MAGLRLDVHLRGVDGDERAIDVSGVCVQTPSQLATQLRHQAKMDVLRSTAMSNGRPFSEARTPSPAIAERVKQKEEKYRPMMTIAEKQVQQGLRTHPPVFKVVAFTRGGEFSPHTFELVDWISDHFGRMDVLTGNRFDYRTPAMAKWAFRSEFLDALSSAVASGTARILRAAGHRSVPAQAIRSRLRWGLPCGARS